MSIPGRLDRVGLGFEESTSSLLPESKSTRMELGVSGSVRLFVLRTISYRKVHLHLVSSTWTPLTLQGLGRNSPQYLTKFVL